MWHNLYPSFGVSGFGGFGLGGGIILALLVIWSIIWKGLALWKSAREGSKVWFVVLLIVNTIGILEILYLYVFSKKDSGKVSETK
jgi:methionyl-tRNA synthetase